MRFFMRFTAILIGLLLPLVVSASIGVEDLGGSTDGVGHMWDSINKYLPDSHRGAGGGAGANGVLIITGIVISTIMWAIGSAAVVVILYAAIRIVTSAGNEETVRKAWKEMILYACLGLIFAILSDVIVNYIINLVGGIAAS